ANILETIDRIKAMLPVLKASMSPAIDINIITDRAQTIRSSIADVQIALLVTFMLVVLVVFVFLRNLRATLIPTVAVPLSLVGTSGMMYLLAYSIDNLSLMALTISTGFVVDDAIVMIENIARRIHGGEGVFEATLKGSRQIGFTIVSITVSLLAVFIPILLMGGVIGRLFREFAVTLSIAVALSALVSLSVTPAMCAKFLREETSQKHGRLYHLSERLFSGMLSAYEHGLRWVLRHQPLVLAVTIATIALTIVLYARVPRGFFPQQDTGSLTGFSQANQDISFLEMRKRQAEINLVVLADPAVEHVGSFLGGQG